MLVQLINIDYWILLLLCTTLSCSSTLHFGKPI